MIDSKNTKHTVQLIVGVFIVFYVLLNINSLSGLQESGEHVPDAIQAVTNQLAKVGDNTQTLTEDGFLQSILSSGIEISISSQGISAKPASSEVVVDPPVNTNTGNIGAKIQEVGVWFVGLWSNGEVLMDNTLAVAKDSEIPDNVVKAREPFGHLSRPYISHVPLSDDEIMRLGQN